MPKEYDDCVKEIKRKIESGEMSKTYVDERGVRKKTNPHAICMASIRKKQRG